MRINILLAQYVEKTVLKGRYWEFKALIIIVVCAISVNFGFDLKRWAYIKNFITLLDGQPLNPKLCCYYWSDIAYQTTDLLMQRLQVWDTVHQANMRFRVFLPVLWMLFHSAVSIYLLQIALGLGQLYMTLRIVYSITQDRVLAFYFTFGLAGLFSGAAFYLDLYGFGDAFAYIFMTSSLYFRKPFLIFVSVFLAALVDERALLNTSFIILFCWLSTNHFDSKKLSFKTFVLNSSVLSILTGSFTYIAIRMYLTAHFQLKTPYGGPSPFFYVQEALKFFGIRLWTGFESFWILIVMMIAVLYYRRIYHLLGLITVLLGITIFTFLLQGDHTRTAAYAFPLLFVALAIIRSEFNQEELRSTLLIISLIATIFFPIYY